MNIDDYVEIHAETTETEELLRGEIEWIANTPEGKALLESVREKNGKPLYVIADDRIQFNGFGYLDADPTQDAFIGFSPSQFRSLHITAADGTQAPYPMRRFLCHELTHANQDGLREIFPELARAKLEPFDKANALAEEIVMQEIMDKSSDFSQAADARDTARMEVALRALYDRSLSAPLREIKENMLNSFEASDFFVKYVQEFEVPAMQFENEMSEKYGLGPQRSLDYIRAGDIGLSAPQANGDGEKEGFITTFMSSFHAAMEEAQQQKMAEQHFWRDLVADEGRRTSPAFERH